MTIMGNTTGYIHSLEAGSAVDGPGLRYIVFLAGCVFRCTYCHNPDSWDRRNSRIMTVDELLKEIEAFTPWLKQSGVTLSGGEPLLQPEFAHDLCRALKERFNLHTAIETQGYHAPKLDDDWFAPVDLFLLDIKHLDETLHQTLTGGFSAAPALATAKRLSRMGKEIWIRQVVLPGFTDSPAYMEQLAALVETLPTVTRVELLPYHRLGIEKWRALGLPYAHEAMEVPSSAQLEILREPFVKRNIPVV